MQDAPQLDAQDAENPLLQRSQFEGKGVSAAYDGEIPAVAPVARLSEAYAIRQSRATTLLGELSAYCT
jgi:hypothetical protein